MKKFTAQEFDFKFDPEFTVDEYQAQLLELFLIRNPRFRFSKDYEKDFADFAEEHRGGKPFEKCGKWFFFPWNKTAVHVLDEKLYFELRTARNKNLITSDEQEKFYNTTVALAGLSVGSHAALTLVMTGGGKNLKLADPDEISVSNLNRVRYGLASVGKNKAEFAAQLVLEMNPYANIYVYEEGVTGENLSDFFEGSDTSPKVDVFVEGVDNLEMKISMREQAKKNRIPVVMATDNGDGIIVDVERFDTEPDLPLFNGALGNFNSDSFKTFNPSDLPKLATKVAGPEYIVPRMLASLLEVGRSLYSWPQLGTAASFAGVASAYLVRAIICGKDIKSGKYSIDLEDIFNIGNPKAREDKAKERDLYLQKMGLKD